MAGFKAQLVEKQQQALERLKANLDGTIDFYFLGLREEMRGAAGQGKGYVRLSSQGPDRQVALDMLRRWAKAEGLQVINNRHGCWVTWNEEK